MLNPWAILSVIVLVVGAATGGYFTGGKHMRDSIEAQDARDAKLVAEVEKRAQLGAATAIAANKPIHKTIRNTLEKETIRETNYLCTHTPGAFRVLNETLQAAGSITKPLGGSELPADVSGPPR